jgi:hypothetical protein
MRERVRVRGVLQVRAQATMSSALKRAWRLILATDHHLKVVASRSRKAC